MRKITVRRLTILLLAVLAGIAVPTSILAASMEFTSTIKTAWDKTLAKSDSTMKAGLNVLYSDFTALKVSDQTADGQIKTIHYANEQAELELRKQIKLIDAAKLQQLEQQVQAARDRYKPLFETYNSVNQQITAARLLKDKRLNAFLRSQADGLKIAVQLARQDIKVKEDALKAAKALASQKIKKLRDVLAGADPLEIEIRAQKSAVSSSKKQASTSWTTFTQTVRKLDASGTYQTFSSVIRYNRQITAQKQNIQTLEKRISDIIAKAKKQLAG
ncbi:hypothetical protein ACFPYJ_29295 [Paenibacillus solisilvae]|uniref:Uncharacterized protein n=1 Tax=Paenibacillus solisilvae TaxID=2486751 RepID=A0ABW0W5L9_9BACL